VWLTVFAVVALIISVVLLFWVFARHRQSEHRLNLQITELVITSEKLQERIEQLTATNEKQRQEIAKLYGTQVEDLEDITDTENTKEVNPSVQSS
jgi:cell division protein FtsB